MAMSAEILVVGAGPAGSAVAALLARGGRDVQLVDRARFPRPKPCGEYMSPRCFALLAELGVVRLESTQTKWSAHSNYETRWVNRRPGLLQAVVPAVTVAGPAGTGKTIANYAADAIRKSSSGSGNGVKLDIVITQLTCKGAH